MASETPDQHLSASQISGAEHGEETLTPLEQEVLDEYARLLGNLNNVRPAHTRRSRFSTNTYAS
jgi:DASH complex subunit DAD3